MKRHSIRKTAGDIMLCLAFGAHTALWVYCDISHAPRLYAWIMLANLAVCCAICAAETLMTMARKAKKYDEIIRRRHHE